MDGAPKVTIRVDASGALVDVDVDGHAPITEFVEEKEAEPTPSFGDHMIPRPWLAG